MKFGIAGNLEKKELPHVVESILSRFRKDGVEYILHDALARFMRKRIDPDLLKRVPTFSERKLATSCDMLLSLGGDGTILRMARLTDGKGTPILGINLGKLGFLAAVALEELDDCLTEIIKGDFLIEERMMLMATGRKFKTAPVALNDFVLNLSTSSRMVSIQTSVNGEYLATFAGDGIIVSTPTGSTGYAMSNGGPIITPTHRAMMISPVCPHTLSVRPVILAEDSVVTMRVLSAPGKVQFTADGQPVMSLKSPVEIEVRKAPFVTRLVKRKRLSYFEVLRQKLQWGRDVRVSGAG